MTDPEDHPPGVALVTGASSGIGEATARHLRTAGFTVHAVARRADRLASLADASGCTPHTLDVRDFAAINDLVASIGAVDVLVNNAGLGRMEHPLAETRIEDIETTIQTNVTALMVATRAVLPGMIERRRGHVVNIGSMSGLYPLASASYGASKGAVHRLSTNLRMELRGTGVRVTEICPGRVTTEFYDVAIDDPEQRARLKDTGVDEVTSDDVAASILHAVLAPARVNINRIEIQPTEQVYGGMHFDAVAPGTQDT
ncbi:MAG: SDR family oxidoreductase [Acidimicrobiales bacterium]|nr:SDR family oxidoreductase [Acidimicrobiales bacterium]